MRALSASTTVADRYRAGVTLGEKLAPVHPEVVFLFSSQHYTADAELLEGLHDAIEAPDALVVGSVGDGVYASERVSNIGVAALGLSSGGKAAWRLGSARGASRDSRECMRAALRELNQAAGGLEPTFGIILAGYPADGSAIESVLQHETACPFVGGLAFDEYRVRPVSLFLGRQVVADAIVLLGAYGQVPFEIAVGNSLKPVGAAGRVGRSTGLSIDTIDGVSAMEFIQRETGKPALQSDLGIVTLSVSDPARPGVKRLRSVMLAGGLPTGSIGLIGSIESGQRVQVCLAHPEDLLNEVSEIAENLRAFSPAAALVVSCAGRRDRLGPRVEHEVHALSRVFQAELPLAGFASGGEFGPLRLEGRLTRTFFHNMTYVVLLIGNGG